MKHFLASFILAAVFSFGWAQEGQSLERTGQHQDAFTGCTVKDHLYLSSGPDLFNDAEKRETGQGNSRHLYPSPQNFAFSHPCTEKYPELKRKSEISSYIYTAECHVLRFEGPGIIHPFNCFW